MPTSIRHFRDVLDNGLVVVTVEAPHLHAALLTVFVHAGARHDPAPRMGLSHFLEHVFFRGSRRHPDTVRMNAAVEAVGGNLNGITTRDHAAYDTPLHPDALEVGFDVLGDMLSTPRMEGLETERRIILEEMSDELDERGRDIDLDNASKRALFAPHGLSHRIAGSRQTVRAIGLEDLRAHHARFYRAKNMVVACTGRVARAKVLRLAKKHFGAIAPGRAVKETPPKITRGPRVTLVAHEESPQTELRLNFPAVPETHADYPALRVARRVLDDGLSSRLPYEVVEKRGLAYDVRAEIDPFADVSVFEVEAATAHANVAKVLAVAGSVLRAMAEQGPSRDEVERAIVRHRIGLEFALDGPGDLAAVYGRAELWRRAEGIEAQVARFDKVTVDAVRRVCARTFRASNAHLVVVGRGGARVKRECEHAIESMGLPG